MATIARPLSLVCLAWAAGLLLAVAGSTAPATGAPVAASSLRRRTGWRLKATTSSSGWAWNVKRLKFRTSTGEFLTPGGTGDCVVIDSGHAVETGWGPENAFREQGTWGGRKDSSGNFYIGLKCTSFVAVVAVELEQGWEAHHVTSVEVQNKRRRRGWRTLGAVPVRQTDALERIWFLSTGWRLAATTSSSGWAWDVKRLKFMTSTGDELMPGGSGDCEVIDSGHAVETGWGPENAFREQGAWGGRKDSSGMFYIGLECITSGVVVAVDLQQGFRLNHVTSVEVQKKRRRRGWRTVTTVPVQEMDSLERIWSKRLV